MWPLRQSHKHINQETLSEHLDGRLQGRDLERVEKQLGECDACRLEREELQATVAMMRQLPMETPRRSFVMTAPPPEPARARPALVLRAPNWVYAGAASVAALALAVTVSVDATGGLSSDPLRRDVAVTALAPAPTSEPVTVTSGAAAESTSVTQDVGTVPPSLAAAAATPATSDTTVQGIPAGAGAATLESAVLPLATAAPVESFGGAGGGIPVATSEPAVEGQDAGSAPPSLAAAAPTPPPSETTVQEETAGAGAGSPAPTQVTTDQRVEEEPTEGGAAGGAPALEYATTPLATPTPVVSAVMAAEDSGETIIESADAEPTLTAVAPETAQIREPRSTTGAGDTSSVESQAAKALTVEEPTPVPETAEPAVIQQDGDGATSIWWRVLEVVAGGSAVAFLAGLVLRWRANRRDLA